MIGRSCSARPEAVPELQAEGGLLVGQPDVLRGRPEPGHLVGGHPGLDGADRGVDPLPRPGVGVPLGLAGPADAERAVVAGPVPVEGVHDVEERLLARPDHAVGEVVRMRVAPLAGHRVDGLHVVGAHVVEPLAGQRHDLVLPYARPQRLCDVGVDAVHHGGRDRQQGDLVGRLDLPRVQHHLLAVADLDALALEFEDGGQLGEVHADRQPGHAGVLEPAADLRGPPARSGSPRAARRRAWWSRRRCSVRAAATGSTSGDAPPRSRSPRGTARRCACRARTGTACPGSTRRSPLRSGSGCCCCRTPAGRRGRWPPAPRPRGAAGARAAGRSPPALRSRRSSGPARERSWRRCSARVRPWGLLGWDEGAEPRVQPDSTYVQ